MNVTYLFGAGASADVLPIVRLIPNELADFNRAILDSKKIIDGSKHQVIDEFSNKITWLLHEVKRHSSIDTFAKKLSITKKYGELRILKRLLSLFFIYKQAKAKYADKRYDSFFASVLKTTADNLPSSVRIVSWNYDHQFEKSFTEFSLINDLDYNRTKLGCYSKWSKGCPKKGFCIIKLNGSASLRLPDSNRTTWVEDDSFSRAPDQLENLLSLYEMTFEKTKPFHSCISFAWQSDGEEDQTQFLQNSAELVSETDILVVIGYSFPFFNREIDNKIIGSMSKLEKVYFQDLKPDKIRQSFISLDLTNTVYNHEDFELLDYTDQFLLPPELEI